jgi:Fe-S-cluster-containing hydrogenase component 2
MTYISAESRINVNGASCADICPVTAIYPEEEVPEKWKSFIQANCDYWKK